MGATRYYSAAGDIAGGADDAGDAEVTERARDDAGEAGLTDRAWWWRWAVAWWATWPDLPRRCSCELDYISVIASGS